MTNEELLTLIEKATTGDKQSLEAVILSVQDLMFNLSLRMLGTFPDAEDAAQLNFISAVPEDTIIKVKTAMEQIDDISSRTGTYFAVKGHWFV